MSVDPLGLAPLVQAVVPGHHSQGHGIHGLSHWGRVLENGARIADATGADAHVVHLFAVFHDARRINDRRDPGHGARGGALARSLRERWLDISNEQMDLLEYACAYHTDGLTEADPTVQACWDADRLDLPRIGVSVKPELLCTDSARLAETMAWAERRARARHVPAFCEHWQHWGTTSVP